MRGWYYGKGLIYYSIIYNLLWAYKISPLICHSASHALSFVLLNI